MKFSREFKIGFVAFVAVALAIWGINYLKGKNIFESSQQYYAVYNNVKGLVENAVVNLNGYKVGNVTKIQFDKDNVNRIVVKISMDKDIRLQKNTTLLLKSGSLISGSKDIDIIPGTENGFHVSGDTLIGGIEPDITSVLDPVINKVQSVIGAVDTLLLSLNDVLDPQTRTNLKNMMANLNSATASLRSNLQPSGQLGQTLGNLNEVTANLKKSNENISNILANFAAISDTLKQAELKALIVHASETFAQTTDLFTKINNGQGTAGQLMVNDSVYNNLNNALSSLDSLLIDLREHPKRYVHLSVFGKKDK
ncbi:MAG TPA: MlaD family protein [Bacteroidales bacterium]|nr:MlaD family protein [Bacteroidales bacterium]